MVKKEIPFTLNVYDKEGNFKGVRDMNASKSSSSQISNQTTSQHNTSKKQTIARPSKAQTWAKQAGLTVAGIALGGFLLYQGGRAIFSNDGRIDNQNFSKVEQEFLPEGKVVGLIENNDTTYFTAKDSFMRNLSAQKNYVDILNLTVDTDVMNETRSLVDKLTFNELMKTTGLNGMFKVYTGFTKGKTDFDFAMNSMWVKKVAKMDGRFSLLSAQWAGDYEQEKTPKSNLAEFKETIGEELETMLANFDKESFYHVGDSVYVGNEKVSIEFHPEKKRFFDNFLSHLNENILTTYTLTELFPDISPAFNVAAFDKLLQEAGTEFVYKIPALADEYLSHGPFQLTSKIITPEGAPSLNEYFAEDSQIPASMKYIDTFQEHNRGAVMTILYNADILANKLYSAGEITSFNDNFEKLSKKEQELFIAGQASAAHHYSSKSASVVRDYQQQVTEGKKNFADIVSSIDYGKGLNSYFDQSVRNYLVLDAMDSQAQSRNAKKR